MAEVECTVEECDIENDSGRMVPGVVVTCGACDHSEESFGQSGRSISRCLALLRENCPEGEKNFYVVEGE